jgi:polyhydroxybutyrate depolymerase
MKQLMLSFSILIGSFVFAQADSISINGENREYILDKPKAKMPFPLIVALHGGGGGNKQFRDLIDLSRLANANGIAVVYPNGIHKHWNDGRLDKRGQLLQDTDDVGFLTALVKDLIDRKIADPRYIVFTGISNGGTMSFKMACHSSLKIFGIAPVSANIPEPLTCQNKPVRLLNVVGTEDHFLPMAGGYGIIRSRRGSVKSSIETLNNFLKNGACSGTESLSLPNLSNDGMTSIMTTGRDCELKPVAQIVVQGGGHAWAGSSGKLEFLTGKPTMDFSATQLIVRFTLGKALFP